MTTRRPGYYARLICNYLKSQPDFYANDPAMVQDALGLSDETFKLGVDWCVKRGIIVMDHRANAEKKVNAFINAEEEAMKDTGSRISSMLRTPVLAEAS